MAHFLVMLGKGPEWNRDRSRRTQTGFDQHAEFMDALTEAGTVLLGGPLGDDVDAGDALLVISADDESAVQAVLSADPWHDTVLAVKSIEPWSLWLRAPGL